MIFAKYGILLALVALSMTSAIPPSAYHHVTFENNDNELSDPSLSADDISEAQYAPLYLLRPRRDISFDPHINKQDGTTNAGASITHTGENHEVTGHWNKNIAGSGRAKPNYGVRGSFKW